MRKQAFLAAVLIGFLLVHKSEGLDEEMKTRINEMAEAIIACRDIIGMNLAIVKGGETIFTNGYGVIDKDTNDPVTSQTIIPLASVTKQFTATTLAMVLEEHGLTWNTRVRDILGENFFFPDSLRTSQATLKDMAAHRLGMPRGDYFSWSDKYTRQSEAYGQRFLEPVDDFRDYTRYNNNIYNMLGYITEVLTGQSWEDAVTERLFNPITMTSTTFLHKADVSARNFAKPYFPDGSGQLRRVNDFLNKNGVRGGAGGSMASTADDMAKWMKLQLNKGSLNGVQIVPEYIIKETREGASEWPTTEFIDSFSQPKVPATYVLPEYGLGLKNGWYRDYHMISHSGDITGYHSLVTLLPDMDIGVFCSVNGADLTSRGRRLFHSFIMDILLGLELWLNTTTACTFPEPWESESAEDVAVFLAGGVDMLSVARAPPTEKYQNHAYDSYSPYVGQYGNFFFGDLTFYVNATTNKLMLRYGMADSYELLELEKDKFFGVVSDRMWPAYINDITFAKSDESNENYDKVTVIFPRDAPATFIRNLRMSDAPAPPDPNSCKGK